MDPHSQTGVLLRIKEESDIEHALPIIRQAYSLAAPALTDGLSTQ